MTLARYRDTAALLQDDPIIVAMAARLTSIADLKSASDVPFVFVETSSGMGKTQSAFAIVESLRRCGRPCYYIVSSDSFSSWQGVQTIYNAYRNISDAF